ncbi:hypothetical protein QBC39DRAFT_62527 [Podospora conica]|nr:hypothetical protein QBC39DRAFT_62527 [Schizothecium conicum]
MPVLDARELIAFPGGDNATDTVINNIHFNKTTLDYFNYTLYSNGTMSNGSSCLLTFEPWAPTLLYPNGTFVNVTWCYNPVNPIGERAKIAIGLAVAYGLAFFCVLICLNKHGKLYLPVERRFYPIGRRWQWYWAIFTCATAMISLFVTIDVDRYYLPQLPIVLTSFFWYLMQMGAMATAWEAVRHWGSWMERQFVDPDPFVLPLDDQRAMFEFWVPLAWYFWVWINFFLVIPRNWGRIQHQRSPEQTLSDAIPTATDGRFKAGAFCLVVCWGLIVFFLRHAIKHYCPRNRGFINSLLGLVRFTPLRFYFLIPLAAVIPAYQALVAWYFEWSPLNVKGLNAAIFAGGYAPSLLILIVQIVWGFMTPNEDLELKRQRRVRGQQIDRELGIVQRPAWWRRLRNGDPNALSVQDRIAMNVAEVGGAKPAANKYEAPAPDPFADRPAPPPPPPPAQATGEAVEMKTLPPPKYELSDQAAEMLAPTVQAGDFAAARAMAARYDGIANRARPGRAVPNAPAVLLPQINDPASAAAAARRHQELMMDGPPAYAERGRRDAEALRPEVGRGTSVSTTNSINRPPQQIKSMLDI